jgi:hypothetical protein
MTSNGDPAVVPKLPVPSKGKRALSLLAHRLQQTTGMNPADHRGLDEIVAAASDKAFTLQAVAIVLQVPFERAQEWLDRGDMKGYHLGGQWWVSWADLEIFLESPAYNTARRARSN